MVVDLVFEVLGMEPHYLVVYFFCGANLLKLGSQWKYIGLWLQNCYNVSPIIYKTLKSIYDWKVMNIMSWFVYFMLYLKNKVTSCIYIELMSINAK